MQSTAQEPEKKASQTSQTQKKILQTDWPRVFCGITENSMILFVASMESKNQLDASYIY